MLNFTLFAFWMFGSIFVFLLVFYPFILRTTKWPGLTLYKKKKSFTKTIIIHEIPKFQHETFNSNE